MNYALQEEIVHFYFHPQPDVWPLEDVPDPHEADPLRDAIVAGIAETLAESFTGRQKRGLRRDGRIQYDPDASAIEPPPWAARVPAVAEPAVFHDGLIDGDCAFTRRKVHMGTAYFYGV